MLFTAFKGTDPLFNYWRLFIALLMLYRSIALADHILFRLRNAGDGGGPVIRSIDSASTYDGLGLRVFLAGRFPPEFEF